ncbi:formylglycine-generating enzyme family protein [Ruegeria lacuscaerulensis]|uniref:formylglycine-generating enzyme family protein n=1 Tax=Ruegeria lacuscaerulensis TaxID=55218 RepID=UPI00148024B4|nr:formylglycine-generating enzyme family protein [Ruegeria lacuscaerulensis]
MYSLLFSIWASLPFDFGQRAEHCSRAVEQALLIAALLTVPATVFSAEHQLEDGTTVAPLEMFQECDVCPEMIALPVGEFMMGGPPRESRRTKYFADGKTRTATPEAPYIAKHEGPVHRVEIDIPIAMGRNEVTYDQWMACVQDGGCGGIVPQNCIPQIDGSCVSLTGNFPVIYVSFEDAISYTNWLNQKVGAEVYRLPTEAEWEYAARAGTQTLFAQGEEVSTDQANFSGSATAKMLGVDRPDLVSRRLPVQVDQLNAANAWGLRHMSGNVAELTMSCWSKRYEGWPMSSRYLVEAELLDCELRVTRGGAYRFAMNYARTASRGRGYETSRRNAVGFRVLRELNYYD